MTENRLTLNLFIWKRTDGEMVFLEEAFMHSPDFKGLTWNGFQFYTEEEKEEDEERYFDDEDYVEESYCAYIKRTHNWCCTVEDWIDFVKQENPDGICYDNSYRCKSRVEEAMEVAREKDDEEYEYTDCIHSGRMFNEDYLNRDNYERVIEENFEKLKELYKDFETPTTWIAWETFELESTKEKYFWEDK